MICVFELQQILFSTPFVTARAETQTFLMQRLFNTALSTRQPIKLTLYSLALIVFTRTLPSIRASDPEANGPTAARVTP